MNDKRLVVFTDSGDTIIDEGSQIFDQRGIVLHASPFPGAGEALRQLRAQGYTIALVADGRTESFKNVLNENGLWELFDSRTISEEVGATKPDARMFEDAMRKNGLTDADKSRVVMVGNNLERDIRGANAFGIASILIDMSPRYDMVPKSDGDIPDYVIHAPGELPKLIDRLNRLL